MPTLLGAQVTLVREAPNDSFDLSCPACTMIVEDVSITKGQHAVPMNLRKPVSVNLLMWRYYDDILKKDVLMANEPFWTTGVQLLDEVAPDELLSVHLNLIWTDSTGTAHRFYLVLAGLSKRNFAQMPVETTCDPDTYMPLRFAAIALITGKADEWETFDSFEGACFLRSFNHKTRSLSGAFEFIANRVGMEKKGIFQNGRFSK
ncbi:MAG: hypothetical protein IPM81_14460 [Saprospirales bacterium]|nr:hypothetical protein [Saprospirales bacterium]